jgi:hypothetical protein
VFVIPFLALQVLCDVLRSGGLPGHDASYTAQVPLFFAADDFEYQVSSV